MYALVSTQVLSMFAAIWFMQSAMICALAYFGGWMMVSLAAVVRVCIAGDVDVDIVGFCRISCYCRLPCVCVFVKWSQCQFVNVF